MNRLIATRTGPEFRLYCELKTHLLDDTATHARHLADLFCTTLAASPVRARTHVVSFDWRCLEHVRAAFPDLPIAHTTPPFFITDPDRDPETPLSGLRGQLRAASAAGAKWLGKHDWRNQPGDAWRKNAGRDCRRRRATLVCVSPGHNARHHGLRHAPETGRERLERQ